MSSLGNNILLPEISTSTTNFIGSSHVFGSEKTLTPETYDEYTTGGDLFITAEPASTPSNPSLIIAVGSTPKILGEVTISGGGRTNSPIMLSLGHIIRTTTFIAIMKATAMGAVLET